MAVFECGSCNFSWPMEPVAEEPGCPMCGCTRLKGRESITIDIGEPRVLRAKLKDGSGKRPIFEYKMKLGVHRKTGDWSTVERSFYRNIDLYVELITNWRTGEVIRYVAEPLSQHVGHGSARRSRGAP